MINLQKIIKNIREHQATVRRVASQPAESGASRKIQNAKQKYPDGLWKLNREDLEPAEVAIYDSVLPRLYNQTPERLQMLAAYAYAASELNKKTKDKNLADHLRRCMLYSRNGLGPWQPVYISYTRLLNDLIGERSQQWPPVMLFFEDTWQFGEDISW